MVDISDFIDPPGDDADDQDLKALQACLQALADAIASTNLAVLNSAQGDASGASARVHASVDALKRFHENFVILGRTGQEDDEEDDD
jgi:hypothetical protein